MDNRIFTLYLQLSTAYFTNCQSSIIKHEQTKIVLSFTVQ